MQGMEFARAKLPFLPPDWTVARTAKYAVKLGVFILVPGLHQFARDRRLLGSLLFVIYFSAEFFVANRPLIVFYGHLDLPDPISRSANIALFFAWALLLLDLKKLEGRRLRPPFVLPISCVIALQFMPFHDRYPSYVLVEQNGLTCPAFCKNDIVEYEIRYDRQSELSVGDHIVVHSIGGQGFVTRILVGPHPKDGAICEDLFGNWSKPSGPDFACRQGDRKPQFDYLILGAHGPLGKMKDGKEYSLIPNDLVFFFKPKKIGNTHEYFVLTDDITERIGTTLLILYKWTGINLFDHERSER